MTRASKGGLSARFHITRTDGKPIPEDRRYIVVDISGNDPIGVKAMETYAHLSRESNPEFAEDLIEAIENPELAPKQHS